MEIAVLIPCRNEAATIGTVVRDFSAALPSAVIYVYDNNSSDGSRERAEAAGAIVHSETRQGKGNVVCRMFADVEADVYLLVDGDGTYDAASAPEMVERLCEGRLDMVTAVRVSSARGAYRRGHHLGNRMINRLVAKLFGSRVTDMLSGYRVLSRRFVKSFPALVRGFEIETAITIHAFELRMPTAEMPSPYHPRPEGSSSKLNTLRDGMRILNRIIRLLIEIRPFYLLGTASLFCAALSLALGYPVVRTYMETGLVPRLPTAVLAASLMVLACISLASGVIMEMVTLGRREAKRLRYLSLPAPVGTAGRYSRPGPARESHADR